jgi:hypothetical protein
MESVEMTAEQEALGFAEAEGDRAVAEALALDATETVESPEGPKVIDFAEIVEKTLELMQQVFMSGDQVAQIRINPAYYAGFRIAFDAVPEERVQNEFKEALPIVEDPNEEQLRVVTRGDLELLEMQRFFGPREVGGNGLLPQLQELGRKLGTPVRLTPDVMRVLYWIEQKKLHVPDIITPVGHTPVSGLDLRSLRGR